MVRKQARLTWRRVAALLLPALLLAAGCASLRGKPAAAPTLVNPYAGVDWNTWGQYKGNLHTHSTRSDGKFAPAAVIELYRSKGYSILGITDHETVTYPWTRFGADPKAPGMVAVEGVELYTEAHLNCYFANVTHIPIAADALTAVGAKGGLVILNHPCSFTTNNPAWFTELYRKYDQFIGLEAFNGTEQLLNGIPYWDIILDELMPNRPVWGFGNDDMHETVQAGYNWNVFLLPALTEAEVRKAMEAGRFYIGSAGGGSDVPLIRSIVVNTNECTVTIRADNVRSIRWLSGGRTIHEGRTLNYGRLPASMTYVRADLASPSGGRACTQPFGLQRGPSVPRPSGESLRAKWEAVRKAMEQQVRVRQAANWREPYRLAAGIPTDAWRELDLRPYVNRGMTGKDAWIAKTYELTQLAPGLHRIHAVPFQVLDQDANSNRTVLALRSHSLTASGGRPLPDTISVPVNSRVRALYVLHGAGFVSRHEKAGAYELVYDDGTSAGVDIVGLGKDVGSVRDTKRKSRASNIQDWWPGYTQIDNPGARQVFVAGGSSMSECRYLYSVELVNPHPRKVVQAVRFRSNPDTDTTLLILAASVAILP